MLGDGCLRQFEHFFKPGQMARAVRGDQGHVIQAHTPQLGEIETRFDADHLAGLECVPGLGVHAGRLPDFEAHTVAGAVKEPLRTTVFPTRRVALA